MNDIENLSARDEYPMLERGGTIEILDVRQPEEYRQGHIEPSRLIPLGELPGRISELDRSRTVLTLFLIGVAAFILLQSALVQRPSRAAVQDSYRLTPESAR